MFPWQFRVVKFSRTRCNLQRTHLKLLYLLRHTVLDLREVQLQVDSRNIGVSLTLRPTFLSFHCKHGKEPLSLANTDCSRAAKTETETVLMFVDGEVSKCVVMLDDLQNSQFCDARDGRQL